MALDAARAVTNALQPAMKNVQCLTLSLPHYDEVSRRARIRSIRHILSTDAPLLSTLVLCAHPAPSDDGDDAEVRLAEELTQASAFCSRPSLRRLELHGIAVSLEIFGQTQCSELQQLEVTVCVPKGVETMRVLISCLALPELAKLRVLEVNFRDVGISELSDVQARWAPLEAECTDRNITYLTHVRDRWKPFFCVW